MGTLECYKGFGIKDEVLLNVKRLLNSTEWKTDVVYNGSAKTCLTSIKFTDRGKKKIETRIDQLNNLKKQLKSFYTEYTGYDSYNVRKQEAIIFRAEAINKLVEVGYSMYEIGHIFDKDRTTIYHHLNNYTPQYYSDDWKKYITKVRQDINNLNWSIYEWKYL